MALSFPENTSAFVRNLRSSGLIHSFAGVQLASNSGALSHPDNLSSEYSFFFTYLALERQFSRRS
jgi:hypothetical protein